VWFHQAEQRATEGSLTPAGFADDAEYLIPLYPPSALMTFLRPVKALAPRTAIITAFVPEFAKRTFSTDATKPTIRSASSACS
jgi:hypothetical protein